MIAVDEAWLLGWLGAFLLPLFRVLALFSVAPVLSNRAFPVRARVAAAAAVALVTAPSVDLPPGALALDASLLPTVAREVIAGIVIGFAARLLFAAFEIAGETIGLQTGLSFAGFFDPQSGSANAVGRFVGTIVALAFVAINGPLALIAAVIHSLEVFPPGRLELPALSGNGLIGLGAEVFALALGVALPFIALLLFVNLALGVVSRVAPQFNVFAVGFPVTISAGLLLLTLGLSAIEAPLAESLGRFLEQVLR
jgi:flagellar biosynthetic protein FliR